ncbi:MAG: SAM-dependent chlorinase/fluorinase [Syntrophobacterales bacterium]|nr:MAG: SAM-dependent chlorinase/fluorinase [Syntrophobacterales bacterium]
MEKIITLMTDFGTKDGYVGAMKGVILGINPQCTVVDITHEISPQGVFEGALVLGNTYRSFPRGSIHLAVVDPEVGTQREALVVETEGYYFVGPDNGLFTWIYRREEVKQAVGIRNRDFFPKTISQTFHGRDIFAPVAAHLSLGQEPEKFGVKLDRWSEIDIPEPKTTDKGLTGEIIHIDRFGNLITNLPRRLLEPLTRQGSLQIHIQGRRISGLKNAYAEARKGELMAIFDSFDLLEISLMGDSAGEALRAAKGDRVELFLP